MVQGNKQALNINSSPSSLDRRRVLIYLILILVIASGLRFYQLNGGLWLDEYLTFLNYARLPFIDIITSFETENQHFLYSLLARFSLLLFGESGWALRLPAALFGVGSILAVYLLGVEVADTRQGLLAAALLTFSYHHVWFSQNARGYSGLLFWTVLSSWLLMRALRDPGRRTWILYAVSVALGIYTHLTMLFLVLGQFIVFLLSLGRGSKISGEDWRKGFLLGFMLAGVLTLVLHAPVLSAMSRTIGGTEVSVVKAWKNPLWTLREFIIGLNLSFSSGFISLIALSVFGAGLVSYWRTNYKFVVLFLVPPIIGAGLVIAIGHHLWPRFFFFALGFAALLVIRGAMVVGAGLAIILKLPADRATLFGTVLNLGIIAVSALSLPFVYGPKQDYGGALEFIQDNLHPGDSVVTVSLTSTVYQDYYQTGWTRVTGIDELEDIRTRSERTWIVYTFKPVLKAVYPEIMDSIQQDFVLIAEFKGTVGGGTIFVARSDSSPEVRLSPIKVRFLEPVW